MSWRDPNGPAVIVDPYSSGALFAPAFAAAGVPVVAVVSAAEPPGVYAASYRPEDFAEIVTFRGDQTRVVERLRELHPRCVLAGCESGVELAEALAPQVVGDVCNVPALAPARRHKGEMAAVVAGAGLPVIRQICTGDPAEVAAWIDRHGLAGRDLVVKPPKSASTDGVVRVRTGRGWRAEFDAQLGRTNRLGLVNDRLVVQEYAVGTEYVLDTFSYDGFHTVTDVCRYTKVDNGPHMAVYDNLEWLPPDDPVIGELTGYARQVLTVVGLRYGAAHTEIMMTGDGPRLIEVGARPHGGGHPRFCRVATGDSQVDRTVRFFTGSGPIPAGFALQRHVLVVFLIARSTGTVRNAEALAAVRQLPSHHYSVLHLRNGQRVEVTKDLFGSLELGFVVLAHKSRDHLLADYDAVRRCEARLTVEPEPVPELGRVPPPQLGTALVPPGAGQAGPSMVAVEA